jgi:predicted metal-binding membrane protein
MTGVKGVLVLIRGRETVVALICIAVVVALSWTWVWDGAGMGMPALEMTALTLFPHLQADSGGAMNPPLTAVILMWWVMMIAMMTPSAAPLVLLYRRVLHHHEARNIALSMILLLAGYLAAWLAFSIGAALLQNALQPTGLMSEMMLWSKSATLSAVVLAAAGIYQLTPMKQACLTQCRSPAHFLTAHWRPGMAGSFLLGVRHGAYCVGCCWMLMAVLFVVGIMNLIWIGVLSLIVLAEKALPAGGRIGRAFGVVLICWSVATLLI